MHLTKQTQTKISVANIRKLPGSKQIFFSPSRGSIEQMTGRQSCLLTKEKMGFLGPLASRYILRKIPMKSTIQSSRERKKCADFLRPHGGFGSRREPDKRLDFSAAGPSISAWRRIDERRAPSPMFSWRQRTHTQAFQGERPKRQKIVERQRGSTC